MKAAFLEVGGLSTRVLYEGEERRAPLVLLHGYGGTADVWIRNIDALADEFYVVALDMVGCGFTDKRGYGGKPPQASAVEHVCGLIEQLGLRDVCVGGTSYGALIAALAYLEMPERVRKLIINGSGSTFNTDEQLIAALERMHRIFSPHVKAPTLAGVRSTMERQCYDPKSVPGEILPVMLTAFSTPRFAEVWEEGVRGLMDLDKTKGFRILHRLEQITAKTLVPWGVGRRGRELRKRDAGGGSDARCDHRPVRALRP